jgi:FKBP-type peptidyl-prolyl cis-trans isomerase
MFCSLCTCSGSQNSRETQRGAELSLEASIKMNKRLVGEEQKTIEKYVKSNKLAMQQTETGLWYKILKDGLGEEVKTGKIVTLNYSVRLLDETLLYSSEKTGSKEFLVGQGGVETGLEEGILMLKNGSKALFIMPSYMAHGLIGDDDKIPLRAILLYEVEVINVKLTNN